MTRPYVLQRLHAVHVRCTREHRNAVIPIWVVGVVEAGRDELRVVVRPQEQDREWLGRGLHRVQVRQGPGDRGRGRRGLEDRQEVRAKPSGSSEDKTQDNDPGTMHMSFRPSTPATL